MIDYAGLKAIFGEKLPESHIFFATVAAHKYIPSYAKLRKELGMSAANTNRKVWNKFKEAYEGKTVSTPIEPALAFTTNLPATKAVDTGGTLELSVVVKNGKTPYTYKWTKDGTAIAGATAATFTKNTAAAGDAGKYKVVVTDAAGTTLPSTETTVTITAVAPPPSEPLSWTTTPDPVYTSEVGTSIAPGGGVHGGVKPYTYEWLKGTTSIAKGTTTDIEFNLNFATVDVDDFGTYTLNITDAAGAKLTTGFNLVEKKNQ